MATSFDPAAQRRSGRTRRTPRERGMVLIVVLISIAMLSLSAYGFSNLMLAEYHAAQLHGRSVQAHALADSGLDFIQAVLVQPVADLQASGGVYDNPTWFQGALVQDDDLPRGRGHFAVLAPQMDASGQLNGVRYGLENESTRLNLNTLLVADEYQDGSSRTMLMALPGMTEDVADAILDWLDPDSEPREFGAEVDYYSALDPPYSPRNGLLETVEELLLVRGVTPQLLFGPDTNRNGRIDPFEGSSQSIGGTDNSSGSLDRGWSAYLTLHSVEANLQSDNTPKIDLNGEDLQTLFTALETKLGTPAATFIVAYRQNGAYTGSTAAAAADATGALDFTKQGNTKLTSALDLIGKKVRVTFAEAKTATVLASPFGDDPLTMSAYMAPLMDAVAVNAAPLIPGRINIDQCSYPVLLGIPGMDEELAAEIMSKRQPQSNSGSQPRHETWLLTEGLVTLEQMRTLIPFVTSGGSVYRAQVIGYFEEGGPAARVEVIVSANGGAPRILFWRDLSHLGRGFAVETLGISGAQ